jgi:hypothetical protein
MLKQCITTVRAIRLRTTKVCLKCRSLGGGGSRILYDILGFVELGANARCIVSKFTAVCA